MNSPGFSFAGRAVAPGTTTPPPAGTAPGSRTAAVLGAPLARVLALAATAPSGHNAQPWRVMVHDPRRWSLALAPDRRLPVVDPADHEALVSIGAFLETLVRAGPSAGYCFEVERYGRHADDGELASLRLGPCAARGDTATISARRTTRRPFSRQALGRRDVQSLCGDIEGACWMPAGTSAADAIAEIVVGAARAQAGRDDAQAEFAAWIRWSADSAPPPRDGLTPAALELPAAGTWLARLLPEQRAVMSRLFRSRQVDRAARLTSACGGWLVLGSTDGTVASLLETGRRLQRVLLRARGLGIGAHPMNQPLQETGWRVELERASGLASFPRVLLRLGYCEASLAEPRPRLPPDEFTRLLL